VYGLGCVNETARRSPSVLAVGRSLAAASIAYALEVTGAPITWPPLVDFVMTDAHLSC
jgi:hypothetical protein